MNIPMLKKVRAAILKRPGQFDMGSFFDTKLSFFPDGSPSVTQNPSHCGTAACIGGWAVHLSKGRKRLLDTRNEERNGEFDVVDESSEILHLNKDQSTRLFCTSEWPQELRDKYHNSATAKIRANVAADRIDHFIKTKGRE